MWLAGIPLRMASADLDDNVLGTSTADQVLQQWKIFLESSAKTLRERTLCQGDANILPAAGPAICTIGGTGTDRTSPAEKLGLYDSPVGQAAAFISTTLRESRACVAVAEGLLRHLALFGERQTTEAVGNAQRMDSALFIEFGELLPKLQSISHVLSRVAVLTEHLLRQLVGLHSAGASGKNSLLRGVETLAPPWPVIEALGDLLLVPVTVDGLVLENGKLREAFRSYKWLVSNSKNVDSELPADAAVALEGKLKELDTMMSSDTFDECAMRIHKSMQTLKMETSVAALRDRLVRLLKAKLEDSETTHVSRFELPAESLVPAVCTLVLVTKVWPQGKSDYKLIAEVWKMHKNKKPVVVLKGRVAWCIGDFLQAQFRTQQYECGLQEDMKALRQKQAAKLDDGSFVHEMRKLQVTVQGWLAGIGTTVRALSAGDLSKSLKDADFTLKRGLVLALKVRGLLEEYLILHIRENVPIQKSCLPSISIGFQLLKVIESGPSTLRWPELSVFLHRHLVLRVHKDLQDALRKLESKRGSTTVASIIAALKAALGSLHYVVGGGAPSALLDDYFDVGALALCLASAVLPPADKKHTGTEGRWLEVRLAYRWQLQLKRLCDTSWCFWIRALFPMLLMDIQSRPHGASALCGLTQAFAAPLESLLAESGADAEPPVLAVEYLHHLRLAVQNQIIAPLCRMLDGELRNYTHGVMQGQKQMIAHNANNAVRALLGLRPLRLGPKVVLDIKDQVELRLGKAFYDLTAMQPQDAETYQRMRSLAKQRYGLDILDGWLPAGSQDNGLDVITLMREIHKLAAQYSYSVHQQFFTQSDNQQEKKLHVVTLDHVAASVRVHGVGIINTAAAFSIPFLNQKLEVIVKFMMHDNVRSRMLADKAWVENRKKAGERGYSWSRAEETMRAIRSFGGASDGTSFLDKLRLVITQMGNSLGYVRMVRNAGLRVIAKNLAAAEIFSPSGTRGAVPAAVKDEDGKLDRSMFAAAKAAECDARVMKAAEVADDFASGVHRRFEAPADHLLILSTFFGSPERRAAAMKRGASLFHLLVPALSLSFLDALLLGREALEKRAASSAGAARSNALCFDDGFAVGIAFLLRIFGLEKDFHALYWFEAQSKAADVGGSARVNTVAGAVGKDGTAAWASTRRDALQVELAVLDRTLEVSSTLFGPPMSGPKPQPQAAAQQDASADAEDVE